MMLTPDHAVARATFALQPGDCLLYRGRGLASLAIKIKTWSPVTHAEGYVGDGWAVASRDGLGVDTYPLRTADLYAVLRLRDREPFDLTKAMAWHETVRGQAYDWWGLFRFFTIGRQSTDKQFCFEFLTRWYRAGGATPFAEAYDADLVSGGYFLASPCFDVIYRSAV